MYSARLTHSIADQSGEALYPKLVVQFGAEEMPIDSYRAPGGAERLRLGRKGLAGTSGSKTSVTACDRRGRPCPLFNAPTHQPC